MTSRLPNRRSLKWGAWLLALAGAMYLFTPIYFSPQLSGVVLEAETGKPVEGAIVIASWPTVAPPHGAEMRHVHISEVGTDGSGGFTFDSWGPDVLEHALSRSAPQLIVFKEGYQPAMLRRSASTTPLWFVGAYSEFKEIRLVPSPSGDVAGRPWPNIVLEWLANMLAREEPACKWQTLPLMKSELRRVGVAIPSVEAPDTAPPNCKDN